MVPRLYLTNDSYPELRDVQPHWARSLAWWRAIRRALRDLRFWAFLAAQAGCLVALVASAGALESVLDPASSIRPFVQGAAGLAWFGLFAYLQVSWGGDMMRSHLRAVSEVARSACPNCGQSLVGHMEAKASAAPLRCPECAALVDCDVFRVPYRIPRQFRAFPPWS